MKDPNKLTIKDYRTAIKRLLSRQGITTTQRDILKSHARIKQGSMEKIGINMPGKGRGSWAWFGEIGKRVGVSYGRFARQIGMEIDNSPHRPNERHYWMELICAKSPNKDQNNSNVWIIREKFVKALKVEKVW
jgi:hypothetical protein